MAAIRGKNTKPELAVRKFLHKKGLRYTLNNADLAGKPDLVFRSRKKVVFVHGCFWHGHKDCKNFRLPKTRTDWWATKIGGNIARDQRVKTSLRKDGWMIFVVWACQIEDGKLNTLAGKIADE
jgi:DNA mismatch endonuclease, patch repair protein